MKRMTDWLCIVLVCAAYPLLCVAVIVNDSMHPENWSDWHHNPWIWGPSLGTLIIGYSAFAIYMHITDGKWFIDRMRKSARRGA